MLRALLDYLEDGTLVWKVSQGSRGKVGAAAGCLDEFGYLRIRVCGKIYKAHRLVWLWHHGYLPEHGLDHIDRRRTNNQLCNLREVGKVCNMRNTSNPQNNTSSVKGVGWHKAHQKWQSKIMVAGKRSSICLSSDFLEAVCHRLAAEQAEDWEGCDGCSPAFLYVKSCIPHIR